MPMFDDRVRFGFHASQQHIGYADYVKLWQMAEELGYEWGSVYDHLVPLLSDPTGPCFEGFTLLTAVATQTRRIRCGMLVASNTFRHPALLAKIAVTLDHVSGGRLELGLGAGWYDLEHEQYGVPFAPLGRRIRALAETAQILRSLWTRPRTTFQGRYYRMTDAVCEPKPVQQPSIPLWIGGRGEQLTLRAVAESADGWNAVLLPVPEYEHKLAVLAEHCRALGRDPGSIRKSVIFQAVLDDHETNARARAEARLGTEVVSTTRHLIIGTPDQCIQRLLPYARLGVRDFIILERPQVDLRTVELLAGRVAPAIRAEAAPLV